MTGRQIVLARLGLLALVLAAWEALPRLEIVNPRLFPPLGEVLRVLAEILARADVQAGVAVTAGEVAVAFGLAVPLGALIGVAVAENDYLGRVFKPLFFFVFSVPKSIFLPMFILVFGIGFSQKVAFGIFSALFIVIMSATAAVESVRAEHVLVARSCGATRWQILTQVYMPSMLPILLETLRISMIFTLTGVILAEMYASRTGVGSLIGNWGENFMMRQLFAGVLLLALIAILINESVRLLEARCSTWRT